MKRLCLTTVLILAMSNMLFAKYHIRHPHPHYHTETRPSDDNQDDNHIALLILIGGLSIGGYLLYRKRKINKYRRGWQTCMEGGIPLPYKLYTFKLHLKEWTNSNSQDSTDTSVSFHWPSAEKIYASENELSFDKNKS